MRKNIFIMIIISWIIGFLNFLLDYKVFWVDLISSQTLNISHQVTGNLISFQWESITWSENLEIKLYNFDEKDYEKYQTVSMNVKKYDFYVNCDLLKNYSKDWEFLFSFIPRDISLSELRYSVSTRMNEATCLSWVLVFPSNYSSDKKSSKETSDDSNKSSMRKDITTSDSKIQYIKWNWYYEWDQNAILDNWFTREKYNAYKFAALYWLTSAKNIESANMEWKITRAALAKMMANFAKNIMGKTPDSSKKCSFTDVSSSLDKQYDNWITEACQLWIMWVWIPNFRPSENVYRAEFWTVLSRLLFWINDWANWVAYYEPHLKLLNNRWILSNTDPYKIEKRWNILLMLMRSAINIIIEIQDKKEIKEIDWFDLDRPEWLTLLEIVEVIDPSLIREARNILTNNLSDNLIKEADLSLPNVCYKVESWNNLSIYWNFMPYSQYVDIRLWDKDNAFFYTIGTIPMWDEYFHYQIENPDKRVYLSLIPNNIKWEEYAFDVDFKVEENTCKVKKLVITKEVEDLRNDLWKAAYVLERLVPAINNKDQKARNNAKKMLREFKNSDDIFIKNIWTYLLMLVD